MMNLGVIKSIIFNRLTDGHNINESKERFSKFVSAIRQDPFLQVEYVVYKNLEDRYIEDKSLAADYVNENINLIKNFTLEDYNGAIKKLEEVLGVDEVTEFVNAGDLKFSNLKKHLYDNIDAVIHESLDRNFKNLDKYYDSFTQIVEHIKTNIPKKENSNQLLESITKHFPGKSVMELAVTKFNKKTSHFTNEEKKLFHTLSKSTDKDKIEIYETLKKDNVSLLNEVLEKSGKSVIDVSIHESIDKINKMEYDSKNVVKDIVKLHNLKYGSLLAVND